MWVQPIPVKQIGLFVVRNLDVEKLRQAVAAEEAALFAYLFGSSAAGDTSPLSDVDVAVYPSGALNFDDRLGIIQRLSLKMVLDNLDVAFLDRVQNLYLLNAIIEEGILLLDRDRDRRELFEVNTQHKFLDFQYQRKLFMGE